MGRENRRVDRPPTAILLTAKSTASKVATKSKTGVAWQPTRSCVALGCYAVFEAERVIRRVSAPTSLQFLSANWYE